MAGSNGAATPAPEQTRAILRDAHDQPTAGVGTDAEKDQRRAQVTAGRPAIH